MTSTVTPETIEERDEVVVLGKSFEYKWIVAGVYVMALFLDILDVTIVNVALPDVGKELHSGNVEWVVIGYTLALAVSIPLAGWWSDTIGTKKAFLISLFFFIGGSAACGFAHSMSQLITFRILQGVGGGMLTPVGMAMMYRAFKPSERARAATVVMIPTLLAPALGPILGGVITTNFGWKWIFWVNLPIGFLAFLFGSLYVREHREPAAGSFDLPGFVLSASGLTLALFALSEGPRAGWSNAITWGTGLGGLALLTAFVFAELNTSAPMLDLRLLGNRMFRNANIVMAFAMASFLGLLFILPLYLQNYRGFSPMKSGFTTFPQALGVMMMGQIVGRVYRKVGPRRLVGTGFGIATGVIALFLFIGPNTNLWFIRILMFSRGLAVGAAFMPIQAACYATISPQAMGRASSMFSTMRQVSISLGVAILSSILVVFSPLVGKPQNMSRALHGYHVAILAAIALCGLASLMAWFLIDDRDAAVTLDPDMVARRLKD
jgi:EmrB/QacA subfamily drug resistance transporter